MQVTSDVLAALLTNYQMQFGETWNRERDQSDGLKLARRVESKTNTETVPFRGGVPTPQKTTHSTLVFEDVSLYTMSMTHDEWQTGWQIERAVFEDDRLGLYANVPAEYAKAAANHVGRLIKGLPERTDIVAYDGGAFFGTTRTIGLSAAIVNTFTGTGTSVSQFQADLQTAWALMNLYQNDKGVVMGLEPNAILVPSALRQTAWQALNANQAAGNSALNQQVIPPNVTSFSGSGYTVYVDEMLTDTNNWYLAYLGDGDQFPFVWTDRVTPQLSGTVDVNSPVWYKEKKVEYATYARYQVGFGDPRFCVRVVN